MIVNRFSRINSSQRFNTLLCTHFNSVNTIVLHLFDHSVKMLLPKEMVGMIGRVENVKEITEPAKVLQVSFVFRHTGNTS